MKNFRALCLIILCISIVSCKSKKEVKEVAVDNPTGNSGSTAQEPAVGLNLGNAAPEIIMQGVSGKSLTLSSLKGKMVLIDFWASWCGPCRYENPTVVKAYRLYKDKKLKGGKGGLTIFSVSLDANAEAWKKAIEKDSLSWDYHVCDLRGWGNEAAAKYGVSGIPTNFLINDKGIIINRNLRGNALLEALENLSK